MKGNYPNPALPSALQYLSFFPFSDSTQHSRCSISGYSSFPRLDSTRTPSFLPLIAHNAPLPSPPQPFIPCSLTSSFICPCVPSPVTTRSSLLSSLLFSPSPFLPLPLFTSSSILGGAINRRTHKGTLMNKTTWWTSRFQQLLEYHITLCKT